MGVEWRVAFQDVAGRVHPVNDVQPVFVSHVTIPLSAGPLDMLASGLVPAHHYRVVVEPQKLVGAISAIDQRIGAIAIALPVYVYRRGWMARQFGDAIDRFHSWRFRQRRRRAGYRP